MSPTIGVFDSGFGGLTVLRALIQRLPQARFAFLGDTARLPYGSKSRRTIARYAAQSAQFLVREQGAEFLVIACNTASALALDAIREAVSVPVLGVIEPGAQAARAASRTGDALVIATEATVHSGAYSAACRALGLNALERACPLLVPLVEEGWTDHPVTEQVARIYLDELTAAAAARGLHPDTLVLGCTHYPLLRPLIERIAPAGIAVIDSAESTAETAVQRFTDAKPVPHPSRGILREGWETSSAQSANTEIPGAPSLRPHLPQGWETSSAQSADTEIPGASSAQSGETEISGAPSLRPPLPQGWEATSAQSADTEIHCFATDSVEKFARLGSRFLGRPVGAVELIDLGG